MPVDEGNCHAFSFNNTHPCLLSDLALSSDFI